VSAVVATYNRRARLPGFLDALLAAEPDEVVVAVDGCDDGSFEYLEERARSEARIRPVLVDHLGQFGALDSAARAADGDVLLLLDDDVEAAPELVELHRLRHESSERLVVQGYMPVRLEPNPAPSRFLTVLYSREYERRRAVWSADDSSVLLNLWGGNLSLRRADYLDLDYRPLAGPPSASEVRLYNQDRDLGLSCIEAGLQGTFERRALAWHLHERDLDGFLRDSYGQGACTVLLHRRHPTLVAPPGTSASRLGWAAEKLARRPAASSQVVAGARSAIDLAVRRGWTTQATRGARLARAVQVARGAQRMRTALDADLASSAS
jgi:glycosyltransferase involved in cell wall biosynthesis